MYDENLGVISVCTDCQASADGEPAHDRDPNLPPVWSRIRFGFSVTAGGTHTDSCDARDTDGFCDCADLGFSHYACEGCGNWRAGGRFAYTLWATSRESAMLMHDNMMTRARWARQNGFAQVAIETLNSATQWGRYMIGRYRDLREWQEYFPA